MFGSDFPCSHVLAASVVSVILERLCVNCELLFLVWSLLVFVCLLIKWIVETLKIEKRVGRQRGRRRGGEVGGKEGEEREEEDHGENDTIEG